MVLLEVLLVWALLMYVPTLCSAALGRCFGIEIEHLLLGNGPRLIRRAKFSIGLIPWSSHVRFKHTQNIEKLDLSPLDSEGAIDRCGRWVAVLVTVSGPLSLLIVATLVLGFAAFDSFATAFWQILSGAASPLAQAQRYLDAFASSVVPHGFVTIFAVSGTKLAAFQLLPLYAQPGLKLIGVFFPTLEQRVAERPGPYVIALCAIVLSWSVAAAVYWG